MVKSRLLGNTFKFKLDKWDPALPPLEKYNNKI